MCSPRQARFDRLAGRSLAHLPEELGEAEQLLPRDARRDVDAVDAELGQVAQHLQIGFALGAKQHAVDVRLPVNHVQVQRRTASRRCRCSVSSSSASFCSIAGWPDGIHAGQTAKRDEAL